MGRAHQFLFLALWLATGLASGQQPGGGEAVPEPKPLTIIRKDGTRVTGHFISVKNGAYTLASVKTGTMIQVPATEVKRVTFDADKKAGMFSMEAWTEKLLASPTLMEAMTRLAEDKQVQAVLDDPKLMKALDEGQYYRVMKDKKIRGLLSNDSVQTIVGGLTGKEAPKEAKPVAGDTTPKR